MDEFHFQIPGTVVVGEGVSRKLHEHVRLLGAHKALIVTDAYFANNGLAASIVEQLESHGIAADVFPDVQPDPTDQNVRAGLARYRAFGADIVVALGGGSSLDAGKVIAILTTNPEPVRQYKGYHKVAHSGAPLIAIPTTAGTGSEVTKVAVITDTERKEKMMMLDARLTPSVALVDFELSMSMPPALTAHVGVDTLTHAIEAYVSRRANPLTDPLALSCIELVDTHLYTAWREPDNREARAAMSLAACQGGMAFANSSVCLVHGMSRPLGAVYHLPHGLSNAVLLPAVTRFSIGGALKRYATIARHMNVATDRDSDEKSAVALVDRLEELNAQLAVPRLRDLVNVDKKTFETSLSKMAGDALASGSPQNNPVIPSELEIVELYLKAW